MRLIFLSIFLLIFLNQVVAQNIRQGKWRGLISYGQNEVPFNFSVEPAENGENVITLRNGPEEILLANLQWEDDSLIIPMHTFDAEIRAKVSDEQMTGRWVKHYKAKASRPFTAALGKPRFAGAANKEVRLAVPKKLKMTMKPEFGMSYEAMGIFTQEGQKITGTVMAEIGDFRYFEGIVNGDSLLASSFDGVHAFLLKAKFDGKFWQGEFIMDNNYAEPWTGTVDPDFSLADPFVTLDQSDPEKLAPYFDILTAGSGFNTLNPDDFLGKVTIIQLMGSWCPNSLDETNYLTTWYTKNKDKGIEVLAVFYEMNYSKAYGMRRMHEYVAHNAIPYPTALGGPANKGQAALAFPFVSKLQAFPTLVILDKLGQARYMHTYFQGPATGEYYEQFDQRFREIVEELLEE